MTNDSETITDEEDSYSEEWTIGIRDKPYMGVKIKYGKTFPPALKEKAVKEVISTLNSRYEDVKKGNNHPKPADFPVQKSSGGSWPKKENDPTAEYVEYQGKRRKIYTMGGKKGIYVAVGDFRSLVEVGLSKPEKVSEGSWNGNLQAQGKEL